MTMTKHTQGPWRVVEEPHQKMISNWGIQIGSHKISFFPYVYQYADIEKTCGGYVTDQEMHANARLIAAAPDLLESAKLLIDSYDICRKDRTPDVIFERLRAAIAKATGETV